MTDRHSEIIELIRKEVKPALGCTEPIALALATAKASELFIENEVLEDRLSGDFLIDVEVSANILKNGMGVGIPGTGMVGLFIAAALGAICGKSRYGLEVLKDLNEESTSAAKRLVERKSVKISLADTDRKLYIKAKIETVGKDGRTHSSEVTIEDDHDRITDIIYDGRVISAGHKEVCKQEQKETIDYGLTVGKSMIFQ